MAHISLLGVLFVAAGFAHHGWSLENEALSQDIHSLLWQVRRGLHPEQLVLDELFALLQLLLLL